MIVTDEDGASSGDDDIDQVIIRFSITQRTSYTPIETFSGIRTQYPTVTRLKYKLSCDTDYYGSYCTVYCRARDDSTGHYTCDSVSGDKICITGYSGAECDIGKFL